MTPEEIAARIGARTGRHVVVRPVPGHAPYRWQVSLPECPVPLPTVADELAVDAEAVGEGLIVRLTDDHLARALDEAAAVHVQTLPPPAEGRPVTLTRDAGRVTWYGELAREVGPASARWSVSRSSDGRQIDCPVVDLATLTLRNPLFPVLLASVRLQRAPAHDPHAAQVATLTVAWPQAVREFRRTGRPRALIQHVEALADAVLTWTEQRPRPDDTAPDPLAPWTGERLARTSRIVLVAGLAVAGLSAPARI